MWSKNSGKILASHGSTRRARIRPCKTIKSEWTWSKPLMSVFNAQWSRTIKNHQEHQEAAVIMASPMFPETEPASKPLLSSLWTIINHWPIPIDNQLLSHYQSLLTTKYTLTKHQVSANVPIGNVRKARWNDPAWNHPLLNSEAHDQPFGYWPLLVDKDISVWLLDSSLLAPRW